ncbi:hypothetical protein HPO96_02260 [Kribbella sandramycini]|uniref:Uncharacterized protein n=1 Tax=Kribbella sandramycini TaxID=60450 RepID=A0A7Y4KWP4_9ACTN|nr:hypothetical protein [Kribbella sandramycini]MBB6568347.1 hypothetical protein [Kribbella sandramycini]NOL39061.1 hypothetical protein [Kribbella sandramycini]
MHTSRVALLAVPLLALAACGSSEPVAQDTPTPSTPTPTVSSPTPTLPSPPSRTPKPTPKPTPTPTAKDGSDYSACRDGSCEVLLRPSTTLKFRGGALKIGKIGKFVDFTISGRSGGGSGRLAPGCVVNFRPGGTAVSCGSKLPGPAKDRPGINLRVPYVGGGRAILNLHQV